MTIAKLLYGKPLLKSKVVLALFLIFAIFTVAAGYEIIGWIYVAPANSEAAVFLDSKGDIWDAQKDMLADGLDAIFTTLFFFMKKKPTKL